MVCSVCALGLTCCVLVNTVDGRGRLSEHPLVATAIAVVRDAPEATRLQALRVLGNLVADDEVRREELAAEAGAVDLVLGLVTDASPAIARLACAVLLNFAIEEGTQSRRNNLRAALRRAAGIGSAARAAWNACPASVGPGERSDVLRRWGAREQDRTKSRCWPRARSRASWRWCGPARMSRS